MLNIIPKTYAALSEDMIDEGVSKIENKCQIIGNVVNYKRELIKDNGCFANLEIIVKNGTDYYKFHATGLGDADCTIDSIYETFGRNLNIGEKLYILSSIDERIISYSPGWYKKYYTESCKSNYSLKEYTLDYGNNYDKFKVYLGNNFIYGIIIFIFLVIIFYKFFKLNKTYKKINSFGVDFFICFIQKNYQLIFCKLFFVLILHNI